MKLLHSETADIHLSDSAMSHTQTGVQLSQLCVYVFVCACMHVCVCKRETERGLKTHYTGLWRLNDFCFACFIVTLKRQENKLPCKPVHHITAWRLPTVAYTLLRDDVWKAARKLFLKLKTKKSCNLLHQKNAGSKSLNDLKYKKIWRKTKGYKHTDIPKL